MNSDRCPAFSEAELASSVRAGSFSDLFPVIASRGRLSGRGGVGVGVGRVDCWRRPVVWNGCVWRGGAKPRRKWLFETAPACFFETAVSRLSGCFNLLRPCRRLIAASRPAAPSPWRWKPCLPVVEAFRGSHWFIWTPPPPVFHTLTLSQFTLYLFSIHK